jgi:hypothetical protein
MKRRDTNHTQGTSLRFLAEFARAHGLSINEESTQEQLLNVLEQTLSETRKNPIRLHGFRVQAMFSYLAAALGNCAVITEEDSGTFFDTVGTLTRPDFRLITLDHQQMLIEVKNHHQQNVSQPYSFTESYLQSVTRYAELMGLPLKFAIYWSRWNTWTLTDASRLSRKGPNTKLTFPDALKMSEMATLGDISMGTIPPLALRLYANISKPREMNDAGETCFTIGKAALYCGGKEITNADEVRLAWMFMHHGKWTDCQQTAKIENRLLDFVELAVAPEEPTEGQGFEIIGAMSQIITNQYLDATSAGPQIKSLSPQDDAHEFGAIIPRDYEGEALHLWRLSLQPNFEETSPAQTPVSKVSPPASTDGRCNPKIKRASKKTKRWR